MENRKARPHDRWGRQHERKPEQHRGKASPLQRIPPGNAVFGMQYGHIARFQNAVDRKNVPDVVVHDE